MNRSKLAEMAGETLAILGAGGYRAAGAGWVTIADDLAWAVSRTRLYRPSEFPGEIPSRGASGRAGSTVEVTDETTLEAAFRLVRHCDVEPLCLNFASARNPGGGFLNGARAQEESLARSSGLYACIAPVEGYYGHHRQLRTCLYSDHMIYVPGVPVFRDDSGALRDEPYRVAFLTAAAVNAGALARNEPKALARIPEVMRRRIARVLWLAEQQGHSHLVLGAWGCGAFGNDPEQIADLFRDALAPGVRFGAPFPTSSSPCSTRPATSRTCGPSTSGFPDRAGAAARRCAEGPRL